MRHYPDIRNNTPLSQAKPACGGLVLAATALFSSHLQPLPEVAARRDLLAAFRSRLHV